MHRATIYMAGLIVSTSLIVLTDLSHAQENVGQVSVGTIRLDFPVDKSVGFLEIFEEQNPDLLALSSKESRLLSAMGSLTIPKDSFISLKVGKECDLSFLGRLPTDSLQRLQIRDRDLDEDALKLITRFSSLRALDLNGCRISENAFRSASVIESLKRLEVSTQDESEKQHVKSLAVWAASLPSLEYLYATPSLTAVNIQSFVGHPKLATLELVIERDQHALVFKLLKQLPALSGLIVTVNKDVSPRALDRLSSFQGLESLTLVGAEVDGELLKELSKCAKLEELRMIMIRPGKEFHAGLGTIQSLQRFLLSTDIWKDRQAERAFLQELPNTLLGLPEVRDLPSFRSLSEPLFDKILARRETVESLEINELAPGFDIKRLAELAELKALKTLQLTSVPIDDNDLQILKPLENLEDTQLTDVCMKDLASTKALRSIALWGNISTEGVKKLMPLPNLVRLYVTSPKFDEQAVQELPTFFPAVSDIGFRGVE